MSLGIWPSFPSRLPRIPYIVGFRKSSVVFRFASCFILCRRGDFDGQVLRIVDFKKDFHLGNVIRVSGGRFLTGDGIKDLMPSLVSSKIIKPLLEK